MKVIIRIFFMLAIPSCTAAQVAVQNNGIAYISSSADTMFINGTFTNASGAAFTNNGILYIKQDLTNNQSSMATGTGKLYLNGSSLQTIGGTQTFKTFDLVTDNSSGFLLNNDLSVGGTHTFSNGMITTSATPNYMIYEAGSSYTGSSDSRHVNGWVRKYGNSNFTFPAGSAVFERPVTLTNLSASAEFNVKYTRGLTPNYTSLYNPLVIVDTAEYWTINRASGSAAQVTLNWDVSKAPFPVLMLSGIRASYYDGVFWRSIGGTGSGSVLSTGSVTSNSVTTFNTDFAVGSIAYALPIKIISFTAGRTNGYTRVNWVIGNELNVDHYELQRSEDGISFSTIAVQNPFNRNRTETYDYDDSRPMANIVYYRLKITGSDTRISYSTIITVSDNSTGKDLYVISNPVDTRIDIYADASAKGIYSYTLTNTAGQLLQSGTLDIRHGGVYAIDLQPSMAPGIYQLIVKNATNSLQKIILKK